MANSYNIGNSPNPINLAVDVTSIGLAASRANIIDVAAGTPGIPVAHSVDATGDIPSQSIGTTASLTGKRLSVFSKISLIGATPADRQAEANAVMATYTLSGGNGGTQNYNYETKSYMDPNVFLTINIDLV